MTASAISVPQPPQLGGLVLIVDDDVGLQETLCDILQSAGVEANAVHQRIARATEDQRVGRVVHVAVVINPFREHNCVQHGKRGPMAHGVLPNKDSQPARQTLGLGPIFLHQREKLDNVAVKLGTPDNPMLPSQSFDRVFLVHMYHEVQSPYAFLWHLRDSVKPGGLVIVVDSDRAVKQHGIPPGQLRCEFAALGLEPVKSQALTGGEAYFTAFRLARPRPAPAAIKPC